jgi:hypothetical protein
VINDRDCYVCIERLSVSTKETKMTIVSLKLIIIRNNSQNTGCFEYIQYPVACDASSQQTQALLHTEGLLRMSSI